MEEEIKKYYNKTVKDSLYKIKEKSEGKIIKYKKKKINIYYPKGDFYLLVNSLSAIIVHEPIDNYYSFWNQNSNFQNHGICCSLISNQNICQTAPINDVIVGFNDFSDSTIQLANSQNIYSSCYGLNLMQFSYIRFMITKDYIDNTRDIWNELVLERSELRKGRNNINLNPSYVLIYDHFDKEKIDKSIKAAYELDIPIVYIDVKEVALRESNIIKQSIKLVIENFDSNIFNNILVRFQNNVYGLIEQRPELVYEYFNKEILINFVNKLFIQLNNSFDNKERKINNFNSIIKCLENEFNKSSETKNNVYLRDLINKAKSYLKEIEIKNELEEEIKQKK